ncbi:diacylglycerol kinase family protein [Absicoccus porci]|uniref:diacylglycerol/lipid kinase family protein n=1 Tax=Absicoccus porci TaxID=2486576 RepID=UPI002942AE9B|nr:diacylglycerol kinase family protein [Absicoccus porci]
MKTVFIINPRTDRKKQYRLMKEIKMHFAGQRIIIEKTIRPGFATFIARKYAFQAQKEPIHIYVCGGDGTLHEVINGVANTPNVYVSIIPIGTGNDFIKSFDALSIDDFLHLENYKDPIPMDIDLLKVNGEYAINTISFGFDVQVAKYANHMKTKLPLKGIVA